jgi:DNA polymerase I
VFTSGQEKVIFIIDGSSFLYRAYYSIRPIHTSDGIPVQAVYGFCRMIKKLITSFNPTYLAVAWDSKGKTERHELYEGYKATRQAPPQDIIAQKELILQFNDAIQLRQIQRSGVEADDIMFSLAQDFTSQGFSVVLVTTDKDMQQAVTGTVTLFDPFKEEFITTTTIVQKYGFPPSKLPFYFALIGDASDNIPGVRGIGPKSAQELVINYESLQHLYTSIASIPKERTRLLLKDSQHNAFLSEKLFLLHYYDFSLTTQACTFKSDNWNNARHFFQKLQFTSLLKDMPQQSSPETSSDKSLTLATETFQQTIIITEDALQQLCLKITEKGECAIDTETDGLDPLQAQLVGISLCCDYNESFYIPLGHVTQEKQLEKSIVLKYIRPLLEDAYVKKYMHHAQFDLLVLAKELITVRGLAYDTLIAADLVKNEWQRIGLKQLSEFYLQQKMTSYHEVVKQHKYKNFSYVPLESASSYACTDARQTWALIAILEKELKNNQQIKLFYELELPLITILANMRQEGILLDSTILAHINTIITTELESIGNQIKALLDLTSGTLNLNSPKQLEHLLFNTLQLPRSKKTAKKTGYSTSYDILQELAKIHPIPALIVRYRELFKIKSTYLESLPHYINPLTGKIHTTFSQTGVTTGRLSSSDPNLQNIPKGYTVGTWSIRSAFIASDKHLFLSADYSQIELRVLAFLSQDMHLIQAFIEQKDIHTQTAAALFATSEHEVTSQQRELAKRINFSILYGLTPYSLSKDLGISYKDAKNYIERYFAQYPSVVTWMESVVEKTKELGYVTTVWGRRRYLPDIYEKNRNLYELARRHAINTQVQGTAAELMKFGMVRLAAIFKEQSCEARMILQIHDELVLTCPEDHIADTQDIVVTTLQNVAAWNVPLAVTARTGKSWADITK